MTPSRRTHLPRRSPAVAVAILAVLVAAATAAAQALPARLDLPRGWQPEGIAAGSGNTLYVGSVPNGAVARVNARTGRTRVVVAGRRGRAATGIKVSGNRLWVAGAGTGRAWVYSARSGREMARFSFAPPGVDTFINDVVITPQGAYFTDSRRNAIFLVTQSFDIPKQINLTGIPLRPGNNLNGIVATRDGRTLVSVQTNTGRLWRINPQSGAATAIDLGGATVDNGDGLLLNGRTLYVVRNRDNRIAIVRLSADLTSGQVTGTIRSRTFDVPTTLARIGSRLYAVNARFGTAGTSRTRYWITRVAR
jgi:sugar lactone lactonase YvrE